MNNLMKELMSHLLTRMEKFVPEKVENKFSPESYSLARFSP